MLSLQKKICVLGSPSVGKTSTVSRYVNNLYSEAYHSTIGVKIDKKMVKKEDVEITLMLWDLAGEESFGKYRTAYLRGADAFIFVIDGTRHITFEYVTKMVEEAFSSDSLYSQVPFIVLLNKVDLQDSWEVKEEDISVLEEVGKVFRTSAKSGEAVEAAFEELSRMTTSGNLEENNNLEEDQ